MKLGAFVAVVNSCFKRFKPPNRPDGPSVERPISAGVLFSIISGRIITRRSSPNFQTWFVHINELTFFSRLLKRYCCGNQFWGQIGEICVPHFRPCHWRSKTDWKTANPTCMWQWSLYILYIFAEIPSTYLGIYEIWICTSGVNQYSGFVYYCSLKVTLLNRAGYTPRISIVWLKKPDPCYIFK